MWRNIWQKDEAYFAWLVEPDKESGKLVTWERPRSQPFGPKQLDQMIRRIVRWYGRMEQVIVGEPVEAGARYESGGE